MEEINQNPQVAPQIYQTSQVPQTSEQQPSKNWLIKSLLIGILGGIPFGIIMGILSVFITLFIMSLSGPVGLGGLLAGVLFYEVAPIAWVIFFIASLYVGYRRHRTLPQGIAPLSKKIELSFLITGGWLGFWGGSQLLRIVSHLRRSGFLALNGMWDFILFGIVSSLTVAIGSYFAFKIGQLLTRRTSFSNTVRQPLIWFSIIIFILAGLSFVWSEEKKMEFSNEVNRIDLTDIQGVIVPDDLPENLNNYKAVIAATVQNPPTKNNYEILADLLEMADTRQAGCPVGFRSSGVNIHPGDSQIKMEFREPFALDEETIVGNQPERSCSYGLRYSLVLVIGDIRESPSRLTDKIITIPFQKPSGRTSSQTAKTCTQDADCPADLVCAGRGPTQPSQEIPGVCVSSKASQAVQ